MTAHFDVEAFVLPAYGDRENGELSAEEVFWRKHYHLFKAHGYTLRPRYRPDWIPSWWNASKLWFDCEDGQFNSVKALDATRDDGSIVMIKKLNPVDFPAEIPAGKLLSSESPRKRCIRYLEVIEPPENPEVAFIVMPYLLKTERVPFETIGEAVEFFRQIFEGLEFMHGNNIIHGDCKSDNIMADAVHLYKDPPHPFAIQRTLGFRYLPFPAFSRTKKPVKYYLIDFDLAREYPPGTPRLKPAPWGGDKTVPEHKLPENLGVPCDPFPVDVYCLGNYIRRGFLDGWIAARPKQGFDFMRELINDMVNSDPCKRPTMKEAASRSNTIIEGLDDRKLRSPVLDVGKKMSLGQRIVYRTKQYIRKARGIPAIPRA
ncbi:hypothetical protein H0H92_001362 [Tricholoma furcatifolium]|nr:hypothetical protein H0H92_001362 [Tricholoma furcatifolium]